MVCSLSLRCDVQCNISTISSTPQRLTSRCDAPRGANFVFEIENEFENTLACLSGPRMGLNHDKNECRKSCDKFPLQDFMRIRLRI